MTSTTNGNIKKNVAPRTIFPALIFSAFVALIAFIFTVPSNISERFTSIQYIKQQIEDLLVKNDSSQDFMTQLSNNDIYTICSPRNNDQTTELSSIYTGLIQSEDGEAESFECIAIKQNKVALLGTKEEIIQWCESIGSSCKQIDLKLGQTIVPGFHDAHGHILDLGWSNSAVNLVGSRSVEEVIERIENYLKDHQDILANTSLWIQGIGWDQTKWNPSTFPLASQFESSKMLKGRKIMLRRIDVHALWLSQSAIDEMDRAGILPSPDQEIEGGLIVRDEETGKPLGCFIDKAMDLAYKVIPPWTMEDRKRYLDAAAEELLSVGITSVGDAAVDLDSIEFYKQQQEEGNQLSFRIYAMIACPPGKMRCADLANQKGLPIIAKPFTKDRLTVRTVKLFADGALGSWGSAMWEPYEDRKDWKGMMLIDEKELLPLIDYWFKKGWNIATHCIGDKAASLTLDAYEYIRNHSTIQGDQTRFRIEHAQILRKQDIKRFAELDVIASMQPTHCTSDMGYVETRIGKKRAKEGAYVWQSIMSSSKGIPNLVLGSDFPVELPNPIHGFYSAITRLDENQQSPSDNKEGWYPEQRLTRPQALFGFTQAPAYAQFEEDIGGSLSKGKRADFVILADDLIRQNDLKRLRDTSVFATFIDGKVVWRKEETE